MKTIKIQNQWPIEGIFRGVELGNYDKNDYVIDQLNGEPIKILGTKELHTKMSKVTPGTPVKISFLGERDGEFGGTQFGVLVELV